LLAGVEFALTRREVDLCNKCIEGLTTLSHSLCRTIGGAAAVAIISGLREDACQTGVARLMIPGWEKGKRCDTTGSRSCISAAGHTCHGSSTGCISTGPDLKIAAGYVWGITLL
jgi:hypothetical protein